MIRRIQALNYRCLRYIDQELGDMQVLVGPNASGKTTFLDVVAFLGDLVTGGLQQAIEERTQNFQDLIWRRSGERFELAVEFVIPDDRRSLLKRDPYNLVRYEVSIGFAAASDEAEILAERVLLKVDDSREEELKAVQLSFFPAQREVPDSLISQAEAKNSKTVVNKVRGGNDIFYSEVYPAKGKGWVLAFKLGSRRSALGNLPADVDRLPVSTWLKGLLSEGVQRIVLNSLLMRKASPPGQGRRFKPDGSNLPWVIENFKNSAPDGFRDWLAHLQTALPDIRTIRTVERPDDKHRYLILEYAGGLDIPSWMVSDGTLRLLALTLPAYLLEFTGIYLIEEPENGIHPRAVETVFQSLSSAYAAQILLATHSPVILSVAEPHQILCFAKTSGGGVDIVLGTGHPGAPRLERRNKSRRSFCGRCPRMTQRESDLVVLVSDKDMEWALRGLFSRPAALGIRPLRYEIYVHPERDPGCLRNGHTFLRSMSRRFAYAMVMFDHEGCGREKNACEQIERDVVDSLERSGWESRAAAIVLSPELEVWLWSDSPEVDRCLGWWGKQPDLRTYLTEQGIWPGGALKPADPKKATELSLRKVKKPRSSSLYKQIAESVSLKRCGDPAFNRFLTILRSWFPVVSTEDGS